MLSLDEYLVEAEQAHGHLCAGQVLGVRLAMLGIEKLGIEDPRGKDRKRLVTFVEIDRCATDAISLVTGCRLGKRALKFRDWGKMAATFVDLTLPLSSGAPLKPDFGLSGPASDQWYKAIRIAAKESSKALARIHASRNREQKPAADAGLSRNGGRRLIHEAVGEGRTARGGVSRIQRRTHRLCRVRRRHQLPPRSRARRPSALPRLRRRIILRTDVACED